MCSFINCTCHQILLELTPCSRATYKDVNAILCIVDRSHLSVFSYTVSCTCVKLNKIKWSSGWQSVKEGRKEGGCLCHVECMWHETGLSGILNRNEQWTPFLGACIYIKLQTQWHIQCCYGWINSLSEALLHSHCSNTIKISTVVMLGFWWFQFNTGSLAWGLCLSSSTTFFSWFQFNVRTLQ